MSNYECIESYGDSDFLLESTETVLEKLEQSPRQDSTIFSYDQHADNRTRSACTLFAPLCVVSSMRNVKLTQSDLMSCRDYATTKGSYKEWRGAYFSVWVDTVRNRWNERYPDKQVISYRVKHWTRESELCMSKGYGLVWWYRWNQKYNDDRRDGILNGTLFGEATYWHCTTCRVVNWKRYVYDSIKSVMIYEVENDRSKIEWWYPNAYVFLPMTTMKIWQNHLEKSLIANSEERHKTTSDSYKKLLNTMNNSIRAYLSS